MFKYIRIDFNLDHFVFTIYDLKKVMILKNYTKSVLQEGCMSKGFTIKI